MLAAMLGVAGACGKGGGAVDKLDVAALHAGSTKTATLTFAMLESGVHGGGIADNAHFDDASNVRVVLYYDAALKDQVAKLVKGKPYKVSFGVEQTGTLIEGTLTAIQ